MYRVENPQVENKMDRPSLKGFHAQLDCKLMCGNKNQTQLKTEQNRNGEKYNQTGLPVKIHTTHDGDRATAIIMAISGHRNEASLRNYIGRPSSEKIRACSDILSDASSGGPHQSLQPSFTVLSSRAIIMFR